VTRRGLMAGLAASIWLGIASNAWPATVTVTLDGKAQLLTLYKPEGATHAVILSSGDLGWAGFVVEVAEALSDGKIAVLGFNSKAYLESFTTGTTYLDPSKVPGHYETLAHEAVRSLGVKTPLTLIGISEGAGLSVMAASDAARKSLFCGVVALGLPAATELGWRAWRDWMTWVTKSNPDEPMAASLDYMGRIAPLPFVSIQSTHDEFVPIETAKSLFAAAHDPKRLYFIDATNHRFSDKRPEVRARLLESLQWIVSLSPDRRQ
jgi:pimeloyl-ACP methyl ester carboxylesterase